MTSWLESLATNINPDYNKPKPVVTPAPHEQYPNIFGGLSDWFKNLNSIPQFKATNVQDVFGDIWNTLSGKTPQTETTKPQLASLSEHTGLTTKDGWTGSPAQTAALYAGLLGQANLQKPKIKGLFSATPKTISGSPSVSSGKKKTDAMKSATDFVAGVKPTTGTGNIQPPVPKPTPTQINSDPTGQLKTFETQKETAYKNIDTEYKPQEDSLHANYASVVAGYQEEKKKALAGAEAEYARANPYGSGSDKESFMESISKNYDNLINNAGQTFASSMNQLVANKQNAKASVDTQYQTQLSEYKANIATEIGTYVSDLKLEGATQPTSYEIQDILSKAMSAGLDPIMVLGEINNAYASGAAKTAKADTALAHQQFMEQHTLTMEALSEQRLADLETGANKVYSAAEITKFQTDYPKADIKMGDTTDILTQKIQNTPKYELKSNWWSGDTKFADIGLTADNLATIRLYLSQGALPDEIVSLMPDLSDEGKNLLLDSMKEITSNKFF